MIILSALIISHILSLSFLDGRITDKLRTQSDCVRTKAGASRPDRVRGGGPPEGQVAELREERVLHPDGNILCLLSDE